MNKFLTIFPKFMFLPISFILSLYASLMASDPLKEEADEQIYRQGLEYRNSGNVQQAIECFKPLAKKGHMKAQHNIAMQYYTINDESKAYKWFKRASNQEFLPSQNNLKRLNRLFLLLPNESLCHIASFLDLKSLSNFKFVSSKAYRIFITTITRTNFLTSESPYASDFRLKFSQVTFEPRPQSIRMVRSVTVDSGPILVHFRDSKHLREIVEEIPLIKAKKRVYFVKDSTAEDGKEIKSPDEQLQKAFFIHVIAVTPLKLKGELNLNCEMVLPPQSNFRELNFRGKNTSCSDIRSFQDAQNLANTIDTFDETLFKLRTKDAYDLMADRIDSRKNAPTFYPSIQDLCPNCLLLSKSEIQTMQMDYISAKKPFIYIAGSILYLSNLQKDLPEFRQSINYVDASCTKSGVYCEGPLTVKKGFKILTEGNLTISGRMYLLDYGLQIKSKGALWMFGASITVGGNSLIKGTKSLHIDYLYKPLEANKKPDNMPPDEWKTFLETCQSNGFFE